MQRGDAGEPVRDLQVRLNVALGGRLPATGQFDERTERAVARLQGLHRLPVTGAVDPATLALLPAYGAGLDWATA